MSGLARLDEPTGVALIVVDAAGENQIAVASGANAALDLDRDLDLERRRRRRCSATRSRGAWSSRAARAAEAAGWPVVLNPAPARELPAAPLAVLTPNASEAEQLTGEADPEAAARALAESHRRGRADHAGRARGAAARAGRLSPCCCPRRRSTSSTRPAPATPSTARWPPSSPRAARCATRPSSRCAPRRSRRTKPGARGGMPTRDEVRVRRAPRRRAGCTRRAPPVAPAARRGAGAVWAGWIEPRRLVVRDVELAVPHWPASLSGLRAGVMSDLHAGVPHAGLDNDRAGGRRAQRARAGHPPAARRLPGLEPEAAAQARAGGGRRPSSRGCARRSARSR